MEIFNKNKQKWLTLPAGPSQFNVKNLLCLDEENMKLKYENWESHWKKEREWEYNYYSDYFKNKDVLEIGSGFGYDGIIMSRVVNSWTFCDINQENLDLIKKICKIKNIENVDFKLITDPCDFDFGKKYNGLWSHGVLHHIPIDLAKKEFKNIQKYLEKDSYAMLLMYPKERWIKQGKMSFTKWGNVTDGGCPWAEYYTEDKILELTGDNFELLETKYPELPWKYAFANYLLKMRSDNED